MEEPVAEDDWVLQYYIPTFVCQECGVYFSNEEDSSSSEETLIKLKQHLISEHNMKYDSVNNIYVKEKIPARRYVRKHYSKLKEKVAVKCNYCSEEFNYGTKIRGTKMIGGLHDHLIFKHKEKLTNEEMDNTRIHWSWDYFEPRGERCMLCKLCDERLDEAKTVDLFLHLECHEKSGPSSESDMDDTSSDRNMNWSSRKKKRQEGSEALSKNMRETAGGTSALSDKTIITPKQEAEDKNVLQHYVPAFKCQECHEFFVNTEDGSSFKVDLKELKEHLFRKHGIKRDSVYNEVEVKFPERRYLRKHYSKLKGRSIKCNHCFAIYHLYPHMDSILRKKHEDKITERKELDIKEIRCYWNSFKENNHINAKCKYCKKTYKAYFFATPYFLGFQVTGLDVDVKTSSDSDTGTPTKKAKHQEDTETLSKDFDEAGPSKGT